ncbi:MAG: SDR family oxidoreductase [Deltaproteobacteria bacterium]|nr:SDR family oxidoreductase [Deltaproteobacteria bacterium]
MKVFITGGAGFIGSNVIRYFIDRNHEVVVLDNLSSGYLENIPKSPKVRFIEGDIRDKEILNKSMPGCDAVVHLAASVGNARSIENPNLDSEINVIGTLNILETARKNDIQKVVYSSSAAIFGEPQQLPIDETHRFAPDTPYGVSKLAGELQALSYAKLYGMDCVALRYFNVYGPNQRFDAYGNVIPIFATLKLKRESLTVFGDGEQTRDFVHVADIAQANYLGATQTKVTGAYNIGSGERITLNQLTQLFNELEGVPTSPVVYAPPRKGDVRHSLANIEKAKTNLGFKPTKKIGDGLKEYWNWIISL